SKSVNVAKGTPAKFCAALPIIAPQFLQHQPAQSLNHSQLSPASNMRKQAPRCAMTMDPNELADSYEEYARKMDLFMDGPTTTYFQQLLDAGVQLPEPDSVSEADIRTRLWEVIAGLEKLRAFLEHTNHLSDRELYAKLWRETLRSETPAIDEIGFASHLDLVRHGEDAADTALHLKYYADDADRQHWHSEFPDHDIPAHEDPPFTRDEVLPGSIDTVAEAAAWLRANWSDSAFATNRFHTTAGAAEFVNELYSAGATEVSVDNVMLLPNHNWAPYADTLLVRLPENAVKRKALFDLMEHVGQPDEDGVDEVLIESGQQEVRLWWD
ncbi:MAG: hypothetical protein ABIP49_03295, partial [Lysobacterales bacterium]